MRLLALVDLSPSACSPPPRWPPSSRPRLAARDRPDRRASCATGSSPGRRAADWVRDITDLAGPRMPGSPGDRAAVALTASRCSKAQGFSNVRAEKVVVPVWERGVETGEVISPVRQSLVLTALGGSIGTPERRPRGRDRPVRVARGARRAPEAPSRGKIAFIDRPTARTSDGSGYGAAGRRPRPTGRRRPRGTARSGSSSARSAPTTTGSPTREGCTTRRTPRRSRPPRSRRRTRRC